MFLVLTGLFYRGRKTPLYLENNFMTIAISTMSNMDYKNVPIFNACLCLKRL